VGRITALLGAPRRRELTLSNGAKVLICELSIAATWPYINGAPVDPETIIRASLIDENGEALIPPDEGIPMAQALELLPEILAFNELEGKTAEIEVAEVAELDRDFPRAASDG